MTYFISPHETQTPEQLAARIETVNGKMEHIDAEIRYYTEYIEQLKIQKGCWFVELMKIKQIKKLKEVGL